MDPRIGARLQRRSARLIPTRFAEMLFVAAAHRRFRRVGYDYPPHPAMHDAILPDVLRSAVRRVGGYDALYENMHVPIDERYPLRLGMLLLGDRWRRAHFDVRGAAELPRPGEGGVIVLPHVGAPFIVETHLLQLGYRVVMGVHDPRGQMLDRWQKLGQSGVLPRSSRLLVLAVPNIRFGYLVRRALRNGYLFVWQPDTRIGYQAATSTAPVEFLGRRVSLPRLFHQVALDVDGRVYLAYDVATRGRPAGSRLHKYEIAYERLDVHTNDPQVFLQSVARRAERVILDHIDQWTQWKFYPDV